MKPLMAGDANDLDKSDLDKRLFHKGWRFYSNEPLLQNNTSVPASIVIKEVLIYKQQIYINEKKRRTLEGLNPTIFTK